MTSPYVTLGIDPGYTGAIAVARDGRIVDIFDMPLMAGKAGKNQLNLSALAAYIFRQMLDANSRLTANIERVSAMPGQGVSSMFRFGEGYGAVQGILAAHEIPTRFVGPTEWKKPIGLVGADKDYARTLAIQKHPYIAHQLTRKKDIGRADAVWIALHE